MLNSSPGMHCFRVILIKNSFYCCCMYSFKKLANNTINFGINRIIETAGITFVIIGLLLLVSLATFSPDDPNFIFPDNTEIKNLLGFNGSYTADLFFQTFGLIALLIPFTLIFSGINIVLNKKIFLIFESIFYSVLYSLFGSIYFFFNTILHNFYCKLIS